MAASAPIQGKSSGRKALDMELNLVPFIDLLSCLISFLLITAVWTRVSAVPAQTTGGLIEKPSEKHPLQVTMTAGGYSLVTDGAPVTIGRVLRDGRLTYDSARLAEQLRALPRPADDHAVTLAAEDGIAYEDLADTMDRIAAAWPNETAQITVTPVPN